MQKPTDYELEGSNVENIGGHLDEAARNAAAMTEVEWEGAGQEPGIEIWRVENKRNESGVAQFGIKRWPKEDYRKFFRGDSYILLYTYKSPEGDKLLFNIHFWIGSESSQDEYGVAAYKSVELDDLLGGAPVQYREMEGFESELFMSYFAPGGACPGEGLIEYMAGGHASGFREVKVEEYQPRLFWVRKVNRLMQVTEVPLNIGSINKGDCFILDSGSKLMLYRGEESDGMEKNKAMSTAQNIASDRHGKSKVVDAEDEAEFWSLLGAEPGAEVAAAHERGAAGLPEKNDCIELYSLEDDTLEFVKVADGPLSEDQLKDDDVMLVNCGTRVFVSVGAAAPVMEKASAMFKAQDFLSKKGMAPQTKITRVVKGQEVIGCPQWATCFAG